MAIQAYVGLPGSGKSYGVVHHILVPNFEKGTPIYTNIPLKLDNIYRDFPDADITQLTTDDFMPTPLDEEDWVICEKTGEVLAKTVGEKTWLKIPAGAVIVCDEIGSIYPVGKKITDFSMEFVRCWTEHRHKLDENGFSQEIIIVCQNLNQVAKFIRDLVDKTYFASKLDQIGISTHFRTDIYQGAATGASPPKANHISHSIDPYKKKNFEYYESHTRKVASNVEIKGRSVSSRSNILKSKQFIFTIIFVIVMIIVLIIKLPDIFSPETYDENKSIETKNKSIDKKDESLSTTILAPVKKTNFTNLDDNAEDLPTYQDYHYAGSIQSADLEKHLKYAILQRKDGSIIFVNFNKYCKENVHKEVTCKYFGRDYVNSLMH